MSRTATDPQYRAEFAQRLHMVLAALDVRAQEVSGAMGYRDASTLRAALMGRSNVDPSRLARLAAWSVSRGRPLDLHWLLTGEGSPWRGHPKATAPWLTQERANAIRVLADGIAAADSAAVESKTSRSPRSDPTTTTGARLRRRR